jgi:hypothetical protein
MKSKVYVGVSKARYELSVWSEMRHIIAESLASAGVLGGGFEVTGPRIEWNSNRLVRKFLETDGTHLLLIETDIKIPPEAPLQLLSFNKDIVGALIFFRESYFPHMFKFIGIGKNEWGHDIEVFYPMCDVVYDFLLKHNVPMVDDSFFIKGKEGLVECDSVSPGCVLIKRRVFEGMSGPWFVPSESYAQDVEFNRYAQRQGFKVFCDMGSICGHYNEVPIGQTQFRRYYEQGCYNMAKHVEQYMRQ